VPKKPRTKRFYGRSVASTLAPVLAAALASWLFALAADNKTGHGWLLGIGAVVALIASGVVPGLVKARDTRDTDALETEITGLRVALDGATSTAKRDQMIKISDELMPFAGTSADMARQPHDQRPAYLEGVAKVAAAAVAHITADHVDSPRAVVYLLDSDENLMRSIGHSGRGKKPRPFEANTTRGKSALDFIDGRATAFYEDLTKDRPDGYDGTMSDYKTFISTPIWTDSGVYGMVTLDAPAAGSFNKGDVALVELAAELMAIPFEIGQDQDSDE